MNLTVFLNSTELGGIGVCLRVFVFESLPSTASSGFPHAPSAHRTLKAFPLSAFLERAQNQLQTFSLCHCLGSVCKACFDSSSHTFHVTGILSHSQGPAFGELFPLGRSAAAPLIGSCSVYSNFTAHCIAWTPWHYFHWFTAALRLSKWSHHHHNYLF